MINRGKDSEVCLACSMKLKVLSNTILDYSRKYEDRHDKRAIFAFMYARMTSDLAEYIGGDNMELRDPDWVTNLALVFAQRFIFAMDSIDAWLNKKAEASSSA